MSYFLVNMKKKIIGTILVMAVLLLLGISWGKFIKRECIQDGYRVGVSSIMQAAFWGDSSCVCIAKELQNGYQFSLMYNKDLCIFHFERGDTINQYCAIHELPFECWRYEDSTGVFVVDIQFPVLHLDSIDGFGPDMFFMDVNFDGEEEFIVRHEGYNRSYYACFDIVNGNPESRCPGLLEYLNEAPYNNIVASGMPSSYSYTAFDYKKKEIYIREGMGAPGYQETWAKYEEHDIWTGNGGVKVYKRKDHNFNGEGEIVETYLMKDDTLRLVESETIPWED